jgi:hypothetical protein
MRRLIITIIIAVLTTSLSGCVGYRHHYPESHQVVVVTKPNHPPMPPAPRRAPRPSRSRPAPPPMQRDDQHRF